MTVEFIWKLPGKKLPIPPHDKTDYTLYPRLRSNCIHYHIKSFIFFTKRTSQPVNMKVQQPHLASFNQSNQDDSRIYVLRVKPAVSKKRQVLGLVVYGALAQSATHTAFMVKCRLLRETFTSLQLHHLIGILIRKAKTTTDISIIPPIAGIRYTRSRERRSILQFTPVTYTSYQNDMTTA